MAQKDPLAAPDPSNPWWVPDDWPRFSESPPMPPDPPPPPGKMRCPQCATVFRATLGRHNPGDYGVCHHCAMVLVFQDDGHPRLPTYDEIVDAETNPLIRLLQTSFCRRLPEGGYA